MSEEDPFIGTKAAIEKFVDILDGNLKVLLAEKDAEIAELEDEIERLKNLLICAADTLEKEFGEPTLEGQDLSNRSPWNLIIELRKAAQ